MNIEPRKHSLQNLEVYQSAIKLSGISWKIYQTLIWQNKKILGDQFIESTDSVGANIAEGYGRFHYLDRIKFLYNARGSLLESRHWFDLLKERGFIKSDLEKEYLNYYESLPPKLNGLIYSINKNRKDYLAS